MIVFDLACPNSHVFEGWFASAEDFESQKARRLVRCPICDDAEVAKRPSAVSVHIGSGRRAGAQPATPPAAAPQESPEAAPARPEMSAAVAALHREIIDKMREYVRGTEDVGRRFAEEARRIHHDEAPRRNIRGQATSEEADALRDEGIEFHPLPSFLVDEIH